MIAPKQGAREERPIEEQCARGTHRPTLPIVDLRGRLLFHSMRSKICLCPFPLQRVGWIDRSRAGEKVTPRSSGVDQRFRKVAEELASNRSCVVSWKDSTTA